MTNIDLQFFPVTVDDVDAAIGFYSGALGLDVLNDVASDGHRWVTLGVKGRQGPNLVLSDPGAGRSAEDAEALHRLVAKGSGPGPLILASSDLAATFDAAVAAGAEVFQEPMDQPWGPRDAAFRDPAGNLVRINQV